MSKPTSLTGRAVLIQDTEGKPIEDIDTDMIFHNRYLHITKIEEMGQYALDNLDGWENFSNKAQKGDILIVGKNFGAGSSRQQAVDCFIALGVQMIIGESFGAIYKRNAINVGWPLMVASETIHQNIETGDKIEVDLTSGKIINKTKKIEIQAKPLAQVQLDIYQAGNLFDYAKKL
ncbi:MAG: 3-isopropylmalate dehydratase [Candidatus Hermodarchaeota archaeon]